MGRKYFTQSEVKLLEKNKNILHVSESTITYTENFKKLFILEYLKSSLPRVIFENHGFDTDILGSKRVKEAASRWKKLYAKDGFLGLKDSRKENSGRPLNRDLTEKETLLKLEARIKFLEMENDFLKKLKTMRRCVP